MTSQANSVLLEHDLLPLLRDGDYERGFAMALACKDSGWRSTWRAPGRAGRAQRRGRAGVPPRASRLRRAGRRDVAGAALRGASRGSELRLPGARRTHRPDAGRLALQHAERLRRATRRDRPSASTISATTRPRPCRRRAPLRRAGAVEAARTTMPRASSSRRTSAPLLTLRAAPRDSRRPAPWQVEPKVSAHGRVGARQQPALAPHVAGDDDRLADVAVVGAARRGDRGRRPGSPPCGGRARRVRPPSTTCVSRLAMLCATS